MNLHNQILLAFSGFDCKIMYIKFIPVIIKVDNVSKRISYQAGEVLD